MSSGLCLKLRDMESRFETERRLPWARTCRATALNEGACQLPDSFSAVAQCGGESQEGLCRDVHWERLLLYLGMRKSG